MLPKTQKPGKKSEPENLGSGRAEFHLIKFQVSQVRPEKTRKFRFGSGFGYFRVFAHSIFDTFDVILDFDYSGRSSQRKLRLCTVPTVS